MSTGPAVPTAVALPEHLRLPDLSTLRTVTAEDFHRWHPAATAAIEWGPDRRNGCHRVLVEGELTWIGEKGLWNSPDPWTPTAVTPTGIVWYQRGVPTSARDQPAGLYANAVTWRLEGIPHRAHAPTDVHTHNGPTWRWRANFAGTALAELLTAAWADQSLDDDRAHALLDQGAARPAQCRDPIPADRWLAHILAAHPSPHLSAEIRDWCRLIAA